jgi:hypothetical protein
MPSLWIAALREFNDGKSWCIPRKGTDDYNKVKALMGGKAVKDAKEEKKAEPPAEKAVKSKASISDYKEWFRKYSLYNKDGPDFMTRDADFLIGKWYNNESLENILKESAASLVGPYATKKGIMGILRKLDSISIDGKTKHLYKYRKLVGANNDYVDFQIRKDANDKRHKNFLANK